MKKELIAFITIIMLIFGGLLVYSQSFNVDQPMNKTSDSMLNDLVSPELTETSDSLNLDTIHESKFSYLPYSEQSLENAVVAEKKVVLFFHANWCPTCRALEREILAEVAESLPSDLVILKVDYDTELELKKKYGVTIQHTLVQVDAVGTMLSKWTGGGVSTINQNLK